MFIVEILLVIFSIYMIIKILKKIITKEPAIIFREKEMISNGMFYTTKVSYSDLQMCKTGIVRYQNFIFIKLKNNSQSYKNTPFMGKKLFDNNLKKYGGEIGLAEVVLGNAYIQVLEFINKKIYGE